MTPAATPELWRLAGGWLGRLAGRLRAAAARLPGRRLADAERRRPRPGPAPVRPAALGRAAWRRGHRPGDAADHRGQPGLPRVPRLGIARLAGQLRDRRRPRRRPRAGLADGRGRLLPAVGGGTVRGGAGPLPADRHRLGPNRRYRTVACLRARSPASPDRGGTPGGHPAAGHFPWRGGRPGVRRRPGRPPAPDVGRGQRPGVRRRAAHRQFDPAAGDRDPDRPDADGGRLAGPRGAQGNRRRADRPDLEGGPAGDDLGAARPRHRRAGLAGHPRLVLRRLRRGRRAGVRPAHPDLLGRRRGTPPCPRPLLAGGRGARRRGSARLVPGERVPLVAAGAPGLVAVRDWRSCGRSRWPRWRWPARGGATRSARSARSAPRPWPSSGWT